MSSTGDQIRQVAYMAGGVFFGGSTLLFIWFAAPRWLGVPGRIGLTMLVLLVWPVLVLIRHFRQRAASAPAEPRPAPRPEAGRQGRRVLLASPSGTYEPLTQGAREVVQLLRRGRHGVSGDPASALPWYVIAGPPSAGKSSLLRASGFVFEALPSQGAVGQKVVTRTRDCDWRVADTSVWLDTAGRYTGADEDDRDEWAALVETVKRHRKDIAINGMLLAVSAPELRDADEDEVRQQAQSLRASLNDAMKRADCRFPVYLVFTHMDGFEGFAEFFDSFGEKEREQVWGATLPLNLEEFSLTRFNDECERLYWRLIRRRLVQLGAPADAESQLRIFKFPGQFRGAQAALGRFASALFRETPHAPTPLLRGFYFTGSAAGRRAGAAEGGGYYFARSLFREVLLADRNVVSGGRVRPRLARNLALGGVAALLVALAAGMVVSYFGNKALIEEARGVGQRLVEASKYSRQGGADQIRRELDVMRDAETFLSRLDLHERESPPLSLRFGLYAGDEINSSDLKETSLRHHYFDAVNNRFMKSAVSGVEGELRRFAAERAAPAGEAERDRHFGHYFDLLKVYLMLSNRARVEDAVDRATYEKMLAPYFTAPGVKEEEAKVHLKYLAGQAHKEDAPHKPPDDRLVGQVRRRLMAEYPVMRHVYKGMVERVNEQLARQGTKAVTIDSFSNVAGGVLKGRYEVPAAFTYDGHVLMTGRIEDSAAEDFRKQEWVVRDAGAAEAAFDEKKSKDLYNMYYDEYKAHWQRLLEDVRLDREYANTGDAITVLRALSGRHTPSPLEGVLREAAVQTNLSASRGLRGWFRGLLNSEPSVGNTPVEQQFKPLILFVAGNKGAAMNKYRSDLQSVADALEGERKSLPEISKLLQADRGSNVAGLRAAQESVKNALEAARFGPGDAAAKLLRLPLDTLASRLSVVDFEQLERRWQELYAEAQVIERGFPFGTAGDAPLPTVELFFNPQDGKLATFFKDRLTPYFNPADWSLRPEANDKFSPEFVKYLADARRLSAALFPGGGKQAGASYQIDLDPPPVGWNVTVEIDGNRPPLTNEMRSRVFTWPNQKTGVSFNIGKTEGADNSASPTSFSREWGVLRMYREKVGEGGQGGKFTVAGLGLRLVPRPTNPQVGDIFRAELFKLRAPKEVRPARPQ